MRLPGSGSHHHHHFTFYEPIAPSHTFMVSWMVTLDRVCLCGPRPRCYECGKASKQASTPPSKVLSALACILATCKARDVARQIVQPRVVLSTLIHMHAASSQQCFPGLVEQDDAEFEPFEGGITSEAVDAAYDLLAPSAKVGARDQVRVILRSNTFFVHQRNDTDLTRGRPQYARPRTAQAHRRPDSSGR